MATRLDILQLPLPSSLSVVVPFSHNESTPDIAVGDGLTVISTLRLQPDGRVYTTVAVPTDNAVTIPVEPRLIAVDEVLHVPPVLPSANESVLPTHAFDPPVIAIIGFTVTVMVALQPDAVV